jgi:hypothetical protein
MTLLVDLSNNDPREDSAARRASLLGGGLFGERQSDHL